MVLISSYETKIGETSTFHRYGHKLVTEVLLPVSIVKSVNLLLRRDLLKYSGKCRIEEIPSKVLERAHLKHSNRRKTGSQFGIDLGITVRCPGHFRHGKLHGFHMNSNRK